AMWLSWAEYWYNSSLYSSIKTTPFKALYGRDMPHLVFYGTGTSPSFEVYEYLQERGRILTELKGHLATAQQLMKTKADSHRKDVQFEVGEFVYLKLRPYRQRFVARRVNEKLAPKFFGPFEVLEKIGEPAEVLGVRKDSKGNHFVLVRWKDLPGYEATWEPFETMRQQFPDLHLEDKVGIVKLPMKSSQTPHQSISTWDDLTTRFLAQFFPPGRTAELRNDILMFQQCQDESLYDAWTRFKDLL
ncbi:transposon Tf2-12 polyprotein, partial [Tanacetum coccineum]